MWLVLLLSSGFSKLGPWLCSLELAHRHIDLLDDEGIGHLKQGAWKVGYWVLQHGGAQCNDRCSHHVQIIILKLFGYRYNGILGNYWHISH